MVYVMSFGSWRLLSSLLETMTFAGNQLLSLELVGKGESREKLDRLLARKDYQHRKWMKNQNFKDDMAVEEQFSSREPERKWWSTEGLDMM